MWFPKNAKLATLNVGLHKALDGIFGEFARSGDARDLKKSGCRRNIRIQPRRRCRHQVDRHVFARILFLIGCNVGIDPVDQFLVCRS